MWEMEKLREEWQAVWYGDCAAGVRSDALPMAGTSISVFGTTEQPGLMKLHPKWLNQPWKEAAAATFCFEGSRTFVCCWTAARDCANKRGASDCCVIILSTTEAAKTALVSFATFNIAS
jgi:hypothetical protein